MIICFMGDFLQMIMLPYLLEAQIHAAAGQDPQAAFARAIELFQKLKRNRDADQAANELAAWKSR